MISKDIGIKEYYNIKETCKILNLKSYVVSSLIKQKKLIVEDAKFNTPKKITASSIFSYKKELDERRSISPPVWNQSF